MGNRIARKVTEGGVEVFKSADMIYYTMGVSLVFATLFGARFMKLRAERLSALHKEKRISLSEVVPVPKPNNVV